MPLTRVRRILDIRPPVVVLECTDGERRAVDLTPFLAGDVFRAVRTDEAYFRQVRVHPEFHTLFWPNGADVDPDVLLGLYPPS